MGILDKILKPVVRLLRQPVESFIRLETADSETVLAAEDGSLVTIVRVDGARQIIGDQEYKKILSDCVVKLGTRFDRPGHAMQIYFSRSPERIHEEIRKLLRPNATAAKNVGLEIDDIFEERARHLCHYLAWEEIYFVLWTRPSILSKSDFAREAERSRKKKWVKADDAQYPFAGIEGLRTRHNSFAGAMVVSLHEMGIQAMQMEVHDALVAIRANLVQVSGDTSWRAFLPGDPIPARAPEKKNDLSSILWPTLRQQITTASARVINDHVVEMGKYVWGGVDMVLGPTDPIPFPQFLARMTEAKCPFRMSFLIEGGGVQGMALQAFLSSVFAVTNAENKMVKDALEALSLMSRSEPVVKFRLSFCTWAPKGDVNLLEDRLSALTQAAESWGYAQVSSISGDPLDQMMSTAMGIHAASTAPPAVAPLYEVMKMVPWQRASSPFEKGSILFRTPDGRVWPYQTGTNVTTTWFDLVFAQPGGGKSVLMNTLNLGTCLTAGLSQLPFVAVIDIGPSSAGLVSLLKDALPPSRRNEVVSFRLQMTTQFAINPFDTKLGMRYPQITERSFLIEVLTLICTPPGQPDPYDGIAQLCGMVVDEMFRWRDDNMANAEPRPYLPRIDVAVDEALRRHEIQLPQSAYWWDVVDMLFEKGATYEATVAQRYAMPTLGDSVAAARRPQIKNLLEDTSIGSSAEGVIHAFERMVTSGVREFPILSSVTKFSLAENRVCALDLADVCPAGDATSDRQTAIMYMLARHALVTPWWINEEALNQMRPQYRVYHEKRLREFSETPKRLCYDEFHRTSKTKSVRAQIVRDVREGRKRGIQIILASQMLDDFDDDMVDLATGVWVLGTAISDGAVDATQQRFGLTDTARWIIRHKLTGPKASGAPALLILGTVDGKYEQHLINTLGPLELWAFSTTTEDVAIRSRLYTRLGAANARRLLGANFPGGSARNEIKRRVSDLSDKGKTEEASVGAVIEKICEELISLTKVRVEEIEIPKAPSASAPVPASTAPGAPTPPPAK
ncbi:MAG: type IV secretion protein IcmB [Micavibrio sp.]|nr:type IV secretion protein IcmB [Micavibrio sp.]